MRRLVAAGRIRHLRPHGVGLIQVDLLAEHPDGEQVAYASNIDTADFSDECIVGAMEMLEEQVQL